MKHLGSIVLSAVVFFMSPSTADTVLRQTYPGTSIPNFMAPGYIEQSDGEKSIIRETYPGTSIPNMNNPGLVEDSGGLYPTYPGTNIRDYSKPGYVIDPQ